MATPKLKKLLSEKILNQPEQRELTDDEKNKFYESVSKLNQMYENIYRKHSLKEALAELKEISEIAEQLVMTNEDTDWFDKVSVNRDMKDIQESYKIIEKVGNEIAERENTLYHQFENMAAKLGKYYEIKDLKEIQDTQPEPGAKFPEVNDQLKESMKRIGGKKYIKESNFKEGDFVCLKGSDDAADCGEIIKDLGAKVQVETSSDLVVWDKKDIEYDTSEEGPDFSKYKKK